MRSRLRIVVVPHKPNPRIAPRHAGAGGCRWAEDRVDRHLPARRPYHRVCAPLGHDGRIHDPRPGYPACSMIHGGPELLAVMVTLGARTIDDPPGAQAVARSHATNGTSASPPVSPGDVRRWSDRYPPHTMTAAEIATHLADRGQWTYSRSSGPGGQRRDHAETEARLMITTDALIGLSPRVATRLADRLHLTKRPLRLRAGTERLREHNRAIVQARLQRLVQAALAPPPPPRRATRPSKVSVVRRLAAKRRRATVKVHRATPED